MKDIISPKYNRKLSVKGTFNAPSEINRYYMLVDLWQKINKKKYQGEIISHKSSETLMDVACSKGRFHDLYKYYKGKQKEQFEIDQRDKNIDSLIKDCVKEAERGFDEFLTGIATAIFEDLSKSEQEEGDEEVIVPLESKPISIGQQQLIEKIKSIQKKALDLLVSRNEKYGDSWKVLTIQSMANLGEMKLNRIAQLGTDSKTEDELLDTMNYCAFALVKLYSLNKEKGNTAS